MLKSVRAEEKKGRGFWTRWLAPLALAASVVGSPAAASAETVSLGTVAPKNSLWGKVFGVWQEAVKKKSDGKLELNVFYNAVQGDDAAMIDKLKSGQLDGAAVSSIGLAKIHKPILALQLPGLFRSWKALDAARDSVGPELQKGAEAAGFYVTFGDLGKLRGMSIGFEARTPNSLRGKRVLTWRNDKIGPQLWQQVEKVNLVPLSPPEVLSSLKTKSLDFASAPTLAAEQLQWISNFDHIGDESAIMAIGGMAWSKKRIDALPGDLRTILQDTGRIAGEALKKRVRDEDDAAFERASKKMTVVKLTDAERAEWETLFKKTIEKLKQSEFPSDLVDRLVKLKG